MNKKILNVIYFSIGFIIAIIIIAHSSAGRLFPDRCDETSDTWCQKMYDESKERETDLQAEWDELERQQSIISKRADTEREKQSLYQTVAGSSLSQTSPQQ